ncbi:MAG: hypothetical protein CMH60_06270, partial [Myxococcales bacterium]|nr:hypothetical protein [Myxococcales bacterium]
NANIDFSGPEVGNSAFRSLTILNDNQPRRLTIKTMEIAEEASLFSIVGITKFESEDADAASSSHAMSDGPLVLEDSQWALVQLKFEPTDTSVATTTLTVKSDSATKPNWEIALSCGSGSSTVCVPAGDCGDGSLIDFGEFQDSEVGPDFEDSLGRPKALGTENITVTNSGQSELFISVELTNDGIPETQPGELVGANGVFFLGEMGCLVIPAETSLEIPVEYRPSTAGEHVGEVTLGGFGDAVHIPLNGKVVGPHICFRTEDDQPDDSLLRFGEAPGYSVAANLTETRKIFVRNCGYNADLTISDVQVNSGSSPAFSSTSLPWTSVTLTTSDAEIEMPVDYAPTGTTGSANVGRYLFSSNDTFRPTAAVDLSAIVGTAQQCVLIANPDPADFGWVATDELSLCDSGQSLPPPFNNFGGGSGECVSRDLSFTLSNVGQLDCNGITLGSLIYNTGSEDKFALETDPYSGAAFDLAAGAVSENFKLRFIADPTENAINYLAKLPYNVPDMLVADNELLIKAKGGGAPDCEITFQPITPPTLFCNEDQLGFGNVNIGQQRTVDLQLTNTGSDSCLVTNIGLTSGTDTTSWSIPTPQADLTLAVNDSATIPVTFNSSAPSGNDPFTEISFLCGTGMGGGGFPSFPGGGGITGNDNGIQMTITSQGSGTSEEKKIIFTAKATRPDIDVIPGEIDFGLVTVGCCSAEKTVRIYNGGDGTLTISPPVTVVSSDSGFTISQPTNMELPPGEYTEFTTRWCASEEGPSTGIIEIHSTDDNEEFFTVPLSGEGTLDNQGDDGFQQPERPMVDVLWAVDDSGSMSDEQQDLANNFSSFISTASSLDTDYHIGVVTTDSESDQSGHLYSCNSNLWISDAQSDSQQQSEFSCNVKTTSSGRPPSDAKESPLQAMRLALDYPNIDGFNAGFYREEAKLYLIAVTDEEDQSNGTAQQYVDYFRNLKGLGNPDLLNISAIAGPPPNGCDTASANQVDYDAVNMVGGEFRSICTADWSDIIEDLGLDVFNARRSFTLTRPAEPSTIVIEVCDDDGAGNPVNCQTVTDWTFDGNYNTVTFGDNSIPGPQQHIKVTYTAVCY